MEAKWYFTENDSKHVRQIVLRIPPEAEIPSRIEGCLLHGARLMMQNWAAVTLFMPGDTPDQRGPFVFAKANGVVELLKSRPARVAFAFYRFRAGGVLQIFVNVSSPEVETGAGYPFIVENGHWPGNEDTRELIPALLDRENLDVCFVADGPDGPCQGYFGLRVAIPEDCRDALKKEWESLNQYHSRIPSSARDFGAAMKQFESENPLEENPVLDEKRSKPRVEFSPAAPPSTPSRIPSAAPSRAPLQTYKTNGLAIASLVLGIVAIPLDCCYGGGALLGIAAFITGLIGHRQVKESGGAQSGKGMALAGMILGGVSVLIGLAWIALLVLGLLAQMVESGF